jgi:hypothetical protein
VPHGVHTTTQPQQICPHAHARTHADCLTASARARFFYMDASLIYARFSARTVPVVFPPPPPSLPRARAHFGPPTAGMSPDHFIELVWARDQTSALVAALELTPGVDWPPRLTSALPEVNHWTIGAPPSPHPLHINVLFHVYTVY